MTKSKIFIASSVESLPIAEAVNVNLDHEFEVSLWRAGTFKLSSTTIDDLVTKSSSVDFALFVFAPEDLATIRETTEHVTRDNVVFELGLFIGSIGKERCFILKPRGIEMHLPSDLLGVNFADFEPDRTDGDMSSATSAACTEIRQRSSELGAIRHATLPDSQRFRANPPQYKLIPADYEFLSACLESHTGSPEGLSFYVIDNRIRKVSTNLLRVAAVKLERLNFVSKTVQSGDQYDDDFYSYSITEQGIDCLLSGVEHISGDTQDSLDDDIPF